MKRIISTLTAICLATALFAASDKVDIREFQIVYGHVGEAWQQELTADAARYVHDAILEATGADLKAVVDTLDEQKYEIVIGNNTARYYDGRRFDDFSYHVYYKNGKLFLKSGGFFGLWQAAQDIKKPLSEGADITKLELKGEYSGGVIFPREQGTNLRILDDNIWEYNKETLPDVWERNGENCLDSHRCKSFANLVSAYLPDVFCMQEYSSHMDGYLAPLLEAQGMVKAYPNDNGWSYTPIYYRASEIELLEASYHPHGPAEFNNHDTKSYTTAVFTQKSTRKTFIVVCTHLWWKGEKAQAGSNEARASQIRDIMATVDQLIAKYDAPVFLMGDMNCNIESKALKQLLAKGYQPVWEIATVFGDRSRGHHTCGPKDLFGRGGGATKAIDHFMLYNPHEVEVKVFRRITWFFTVRITDHYPNYIDAVL